MIPHPRNLSTEEIIRYASEIDFEDLDVVDFIHKLEDETYDEITRRAYKQGYEDCEMDLNESESVASMIDLDILAEEALEELEIDVWNDYL